MGPDKDIVTNVFQFLELVGATGMLPEHHPEPGESEDKSRRLSTAKKRAFIETFLDHLIVSNNQVPGDIPVGYVFAEFANGCISGKYQRKGNNVSAFVQALNENIKGIEYNYRTEERKHQKALPEQTYRNEEGEIQQSDRDIQNQIEQLELLHGSRESVLGAVNGLDRYRHRLYETKALRIEKGKWSL